MPQIHFNHGNKNSISKHRASINISIARVCACILYKECYWLTFPALQCMTATFLLSSLSHPSTSSQKGWINSKGGGLWSSNGYTVTEGREEGGRGRDWGREGKGRERRRREWGKGRSLLTVLQANLCGTFLGRKTFQNTDYKPYNDRYNVCQKT